MLVSSHLLPSWLHVLLTEKFFNACIIHQEAKKNEKNIFCLDCCVSICPHCVYLHNNHRLLQIRRYVYNDVLKLDAASKLMDCAFVQSYTTNSAKVVFIKKRPQTRQFRTTGNICHTCDRSLQNPNLFCSVFCKIDYLTKTQRGLSSFLIDCDFLPLPDPESDDGQLTPDSVLENSGLTRTSSGSDGNGEVWSKTLACTATTEVVKKKRSSLSLLCRPRLPPPASELSATSFMNRRKNNPQRAPLY